MSASDVDAVIAAFSAPTGMIYGVAASSAAVGCGFDDRNHHLS